MCSLSNGLPPSTALQNSYSYRRERTRERKGCPRLREVLSVSSALFSFVTFFLISHRLYEYKHSYILLYLRVVYGETIFSKIPKTNKNSPEVGGIKLQLSLLNFPNHFFSFIVEILLPHGFAFHPLTFWECGAVMSIGVSTQLLSPSPLRFGNRGLGF